MIKTNFVRHIEIYFNTYRDIAGSVIEGGRQFECEVINIFVHWSGVLSHNEMFICRL